MASAIDIADCSLANDAALRRFWSTMGKEARDAPLPRNDVNLGEPLLMKEDSLAKDGFFFEIDIALFGGKISLALEEACSSSLLPTQPILSSLLGGAVF